MRIHAADRPGSTGSSDRSMIGAHPSRSRPSGLATSGGVTVWTCSVGPER